MKRKPQTSGRTRFRTARAITGDRLQSPSTDTGCRCCGKVHKNEALDSSAFTGFYTLDIEWGDPEAPGLRVANTLRPFYEILCDCGRLTREEPVSQPPDALLPGVALTKWRLVGRGFGADHVFSLSAAAFAGADCRVPVGLVGYSAQRGHGTQYNHGKRSCCAGAGSAAGE